VDGAGLAALGNWQRWAGARSGASGREPPSGGCGAAAGWQHLVWPHAGRALRGSPPGGIKQPT